MTHTTTIDEAVGATTLFATYLDRQRLPKQVTVEVRLHETWAKLKHYRYVFYIFDKPGTIGRGDYFPDIGSAVEYLRRTVRLVDFVHASGLLPVRETAAHRQIPTPDWADHRSYWRDSHGNLFVLIEPMEHARNYPNELDQGQFTWYVLPRALTVYHCPSRIGAFSMLLTASSNTDQLEAIAAKLELAVKSGAAS